MSSLPVVHEITSFHDECILKWKKYGLGQLQNHTLNATQFLDLVAENHVFNYQLWHAEDRARRDDMGHEFVYQAKREIDVYNQQRNDRMEKLDEWLYHHLKPVSSIHCLLHTETPGMIIDRLSILSLKIYHMQQQVQRTDVDDHHLHTCSTKFKTLQAQRAQLAHGLQQLLDEIHNKTKTFRVYHQFKMYNNPELNPELYNP